MSAERMITIREEICSAKKIEELGVESRLIRKDYQAGLVGAEATRARIAQVEDKIQELNGELKKTDRRS